jgi:transcriptional regulator with XRE-family HTH domain
LYRALVDAPDMGRKPKTPVDLKNADKIRERMKAIVAAALQETGLSRTAWAKSIGLSEGGLRDLISGRNQEPSIPTIEKIAKARGIKLASILGEDPGRESADPKPGIITIDRVREVEVVVRPPGGAGLKFDLPSGQRYEVRLSGRNLRAVYEGLGVLFRAQR